MQSSPQTSPLIDRPLDRGGVRVLQAYLRMLGYFGDPQQVRGIDVVDGDFGVNTQNAVAGFVRDTHATHSGPTIGLLNDVRTHYQRTMLTTERTPTRNYAAIDTAFHRYYPRGGNTWQRLHPALRFSLLAALDDLRRQGVAVIMADGPRSINEQEENIRTGRSVAPPGASFHDFGLAVDLMPRMDASNPDNPAWNKIFTTMQRYGFYSLYRAQGWDRPHFELPASTVAMMRWPTDAQGWKDIPAANMPAVWNSINTRALGQVSAVDMSELPSPSPTPRLATRTLARFSA